MFRDPVSSTFGLLLVAGLWLVVHLMVRAAREQDLIEPLPPTSEPLSHVRPTPIDGNGRVQKIGVNCHARACVDDEGRVECVCGLAEREAAARGGAA